MDSSKNGKHKNPKATKTAHLLRYLPPAEKSFDQNVKRTHLQVMLWYATMDVDTPADPTLYDQKRDKLNKVFAPIGLPESVATDQVEVLNMVKCGFSASSPYKTRRFSCASAMVACSLMCTCHGDAAVCQNEVTRGQTKEDNGSDDSESYIYCPGFP